jgi:hypothetical protein
MSATTSCDRAGVGALIRAYHLTAVSQAELRLFVRALPVSRLIGGAAGPRAGVAGLSRPRVGESNGSGPADLNAAVLRQLIDKLDNGIMLADDDSTIMLAGRRLGCDVRLRGRQTDRSTGGVAGA